ncbi:MAG: ABC transporter permease [Chloroflexi bacterium]|nr:ABC transporter permease [Chloroflexota bacterium]
MNSFLVLIRRELRSIRKEKTIIFAMLIQFFIAMFSSIMLMGMMSFYDPTTIGENSPVSLKVGVVGHTASPITYFLDQKKNIQVERYDILDDAEQAFKSEKIDAIMSIPSSEGGIVDMDLFLPESDTESTIILMALNDPLKNAEEYLREQNGINMNFTDIEGKSHTSYEFLYAIIIPLLMFFPALIAGSIVIDTVSEELEHKTLDTLWAAPVSLNNIFSSKIFAAIATALIQCVLWIILLRLNTFDVENFGNVLCLSIIIAAIISFGAAIIGLYYKDRERAQFVYSISLLLATGLSYLLDPSPFNLITRLATGSQYVGFSEVAFYLIPLTAISIIFFFTSKRLAAAKA